MTTTELTILGSDETDEVLAKAQALPRGSVTLDGHSVPFDESDLVGAIQAIIVDGGHETPFTSQAQIYAKGSNLYDSKKQYLFDA